MKLTKICALFMILVLILGGFVLAQETERDKQKREEHKQQYEKIKQAYEQAKQTLYQKKYEKAALLFEQFINQYEPSAYAAESYYWLAYSMNKQSQEMDQYEDQKAYQKEAIRYLNSLIDRYAESSWVDDAKTLRVKIAEDLINKGLRGYRIYLNGSLKKLEDLEREDIEESLEEMEHLDLEELEDLKFEELEGPKMPWWG